MRQGDLSIAVLQNIGVCSLQHARTPGTESRGVLTKRFPSATGLHANHANPGISDEGVEQSNGVRSTADTGDQQIGQASFGSQDLFTSFQANDAMKIVHHQWV